MGFIVEGKKLYVKFIEAPKASTTHAKCEFAFERVVFCFCLQLQQCSSMPQMSDDAIKVAEL